jgi:hypothetical protein
MAQLTHPAFYVAEIHADHDFNKQVARNAWSTLQAARDWADGWIADQLMHDKRADPTFDGYSYSYVVVEFVVQDI